MTIPELPPLPIEWRDESTRLCFVHAAYSGGCCVAKVRKDGKAFVAYAHRWPLSLPPEIQIETSNYRSLDKAKAAAEKAAQAEWKRFLAQLYAPKT
jgi:hypothetical protein